MTQQDPGTAPVPAAASSGTGEAAPGAPDALPVGRGRGLSVPETGALLLVLVALFVFFLIAAPNFFRSDNIINILQTVAVVGIVACPATLLLISGQFDLSVGSGVGFAGMVMAVTALAPGTGGVDLPLALNLQITSALVVAILATLLVGFINAFCVTVIGINALITTLGTLAIFRGLTKVLGDGQTIRIENFGAIGVLRFPEAGLPVIGVGIPLPVYIFAGVVIVSWAILRYTVYGRSLYAIGASPVAGSNTNRQRRQHRRCQGRWNVKRPPGLCGPRRCRRWTSGSASAGLVAGLFRPKCAGYRGRAGLRAIRRWPLAQ